MDKEFYKKLHKHISEQTKVTVYMVALLRSLKGQGKNFREIGEFLAKSNKPKHKNAFKVVAAMSYGTFYEVTKLPHEYKV